MDKSKIVLKPGKEVSLLRRHPWVFSGAIASFPEGARNGDIFPIHSFQGEFLAQGMCHTHNSIAVRVLSFDTKPAAEVIQEKIREAYALRSFLFDPSQTTAYRLINAEGDGLPGLVVDVYSDVLVLQSSTYGIERRKQEIVQELVSLYHPRTIFEKSTSAARKQEGLEEIANVLYGKEIDEVEVLENGIRYIISFLSGQKTGFFLDQREMRKEIENLARGKRVLNGFSYSGGFSLSALKGGALHVTSVDICAKACSLAKRNTALNSFPSHLHTVLQEDVFAYLSKAPLDENILILDPPAFAKQRKDIEAAARGYKELFRKVFEKARPRTFFLASSCSAFIEDSFFHTLLMQAAFETKREVSVLSKHCLAFDHPVSLFHPEGEYLKSRLVYIR